MILNETVINDINPTSALALNNQERTFVTCMKLKGTEVDFNGDRAEASTCADSGLWPGFYSVKLTGYYGRNGSPTKDLVGSSWFVYAPWWFVMIVVAVLAFVTYHVWKITRFIKRKRSGSQLKKQSKRRR